MYLYDKANYSMLKEDLDIDWKSILCYNDIENNWKTFSDTLNNAIKKYVPIIILDDSKQRKKYNRKLICKIKKKQRLWERIKRMKSDHMEDNIELILQTQLNYRKLNNQIRRETRKITKNKEQEIVNKSKSNQKIFWKYVNNKRSVQSNIPHLYIDNKKIEKTKNDKEKAETLSKYFNEVFVVESNDDTEILKVKTSANINETDFEDEEIRKAIINLRMDKSPG